MLSTYIKAGYTPIMGCREDTALNYVSFIFEGAKSQLNAESIEVEFIPGKFIPSGYFFENNLLLKSSL